MCKTTQGCVHCFRNNPIKPSPARSEHMQRFISGFWARHSTVSTVHWVQYSQNLQINHPLQLYGRHVFMYRFILFLGEPWKDWQNETKWWKTDSTVPEIFEFFIYILCMYNYNTLSQMKSIFRDITWKVAGKTWYYAEKFHVVSFFPLHLMLYRGNFNYFSDSVTSDILLYC